MAAKSKKEEPVDLDEILLRQIEVRRNPTGSVLGSIPEIAADTSLQPEEFESVEELPAQPDSAIKEAGSRAVKKGTGQSGYELLFLKMNIVQQRSAIYISEQTKTKLTEVVRCLSRSNISLTTFVENILAHHLELFKDEINRLHRQKNTKDVL